MKQWLVGWRAAEPVMERLRREALRHCNTAEAIESLSDAFESALLHLPKSTTSGLVEQQKYFSRLKP